MFESEFLIDEDWMEDEGALLVEAEAALLEVVALVGEVDVVLVDEPDDMRCFMERKIGRPMPARFSYNFSISMRSCSEVFFSFSGGFCTEVA